MLTGGAAYVHGRQSLLTAALRHAAQIVNTTQRLRTDFVPLAQHHIPVALQNRTIC